MSQVNDPFWFNSQDPFSYNITATSLSFNQLLQYYNDGTINKALHIITHDDPALNLTVDNSTFGSDDDYSGYIGLGYSEGVGSQLASAGKDVAIVTYTPVKDPLNSDRYLPNYDVPTGIFTAAEFLAQGGRAPGSFVAVPLAGSAGEHIVFGSGGADLTIDPAHDWHWLIDNQDLGVKYPYMLQSMESVNPDLLNEIPLITTAYEDVLGQNYAPIVTDVDRAPDPTKDKQSQHVYFNALDFRIPDTMTNDQREDLVNFIKNSGISGSDRIYLSTQDGKDMIPGTNNPGSSALISIHSNHLHIDGGPNTYSGPNSGQVVHGYVSGATVFSDANGNGILDSGEVSTTTDAAGNFTLAASSGTLVAIGGTDISTGLPITGSLRAMAGSSTITPLTTLMSDLNSDSTDTVTAALGLAPNTDLSTLDPVTAARTGDISAYLAAVKVYDAAALIGVVGGGTIDDGFAAIETLLSTATGSVNLADPATLAPLVAAHSATLDSATVSKIASTIAGTIGAIDAAAQGKTGDALITAASAVERVAEGVEAQALAAAGTDPVKIGAVADAYTGQHLTDAIALAATQLPNPSLSNPNLFGTVTTDPHSPGGEVYALYEGLLGRAPDTAGLEYWADQFNHGASPATLTSGFLGTAEGQARLGAADDTGFVQQLYQNTLHRAPDSAGLSYWTDQLAHGESRVDVADSFVFSPEFTSNTVQPAISSGLFVPDANASEVARIYYTMLDRAPDASGLQYWTSLLDHGTAPYSVALAFLAQPENQAKYGSLSNGDYVDALYVNALGRHADSGGLSYWTSQLDHGGSRADLAVQLSQSPEAQNVHLAQIEQGWHLA